MCRTSTHVNMGAWKGDVFAEEGERKCTMLSEDTKVLELVGEIDKRITARVKHLLETKHLYQSVTVEYADLL